MEAVEIDFSDEQLVERYDRLFEDCPDAFIQQSTAWCDAIRDLGPDRPLFLLCNDAGEDLAGLPLYLYEHERGNVLTSVPQPGPLGGIFCRQSAKGRRDDVYKCLLDRAVRVAARHRCLSLTIITNPFDEDAHLYERHLRPDLVLDNFTQYVSLRAPVPHPPGDRNRVRNLRRARAFGYSIRAAEGISDLRSWYRIHRKRHIEIGVEPLAYKLFENLFRRLVPEGKAALILAEHDQTIAAGAFVVCHHDVLDVFLLSRDSAFDRSGPAFLVTEACLEWAGRRGVVLYNWQSSASRAGGVYRFKQQWGSREASYCFVTKLLRGLEAIKAMGCDTLRREYANHFVVPYGILSEGERRTRFIKGD